MPGRRTRDGLRASPGRATAPSKRPTTSDGRGRSRRAGARPPGALPTKPASGHPSFATPACRDRRISLAVATGPTVMSSSRRSAAIARNWSPRTVPSCLPITSAASRAERPAKKRSAMASRWSSVSVDSAAADRVELLADRPPSRPVRRRPVARSTDRVEVGVLVAGPDEIDDRVPGQPEQPAPERDAPRLVARQRFQGLDEDELRQVLRVRSGGGRGWRCSDRPAGGKWSKSRPKAQASPAWASATSRSIAASSRVTTNGTRRRR